MKKLKFSQNLFCKNLSNNCCSEKAENGIFFIRNVLPSLHPALIICKAIMLTVMCSHPQRLNQKKKQNPVIQTPSLANEEKTVTMQCFYTQPVT